MPKRTPHKVLLGLPRFRKQPSLIFSPEIARDCNHHVSAAPIRIAFHGSNLPSREADQIWILWITKIPYLSLDSSGLVGNRTFLAFTAEALVPAVEDMPPY
jgi:hypothetical protein